MKIKITKANAIYGAEGALAVGTEIKIKGEPPAGWAGKYVIVEEGPAPDSKPVTNGGGAKTENKKTDTKTGSED